MDRHELNEFTAPLAAAAGYKYMEALALVVRISRTLNESFADIAGLDECADIASVIGSACEAWGNDFGARFKDTLTPFMGANEDDDQA